MKYKIHNRQLVKYLFYILCVSFFQFTVSNARSQSVSAKLDEAKILIGDQVKLQLKISGLNPETTILKQWFKFKDTSNHIQLVKISTLDSIKLNGTLSYFQTVTLTSFDSGKWEFPELWTTIQNKKNGATEKLVATVDSLIVLPLDVSDMNTYHDVKSIIEVEKKPDYLLYALIVFTIALVFFILRYFLKKHKTKKHKPSIVPNTAGVLQVALTKIKNLPIPEEGNLQQTKVYYSILSEIGKQYLKERFDMSSYQATTDELMIQTGSYLVKEPFKSKFFQLLRLEDVVKFAEYVPSSKINQESKIQLAEILTHLHQFNKNQVEYNA